MKTTVDIDSKLLDTAKRVLGTDSIKGTVNESLRSVVRQRRLQELADSLGTIPINLTVEELRNQRKKRTRHVSR
jgi:Arc/MetJ family transcription regulator